MATTVEIKTTYNIDTKRHHFVLVDNDDVIQADMGSLIPTNGSINPDDYTILELDFYEG